MHDSFASLDARNAARCPVSAPVVMRLGGSLRILRSRDASATGLFVWSADGAGAPARVGQEVELQLHAGRSVRCHAEVVRVVEPGTAEWSEYPAGFAVRITACDAGNRAALDELLGDN